MKEHVFDTTEELVTGYLLFLMKICDKHAIDFDHMMDAALLIYAEDTEKEAA